MFFWNSLGFSMIQLILVIWSLVQIIVYYISVLHFFSPKCISQRSFLMSTQRSFSFFIKPFWDSTIVYLTTPLVEEHLDCFQFLAIVNSTAPVPHVLEIHIWERDLLVIVYAYLQLYFVVVLQSLSHVWLFVTPWTAAHQASLSSIIFWTLLKFMSLESVMPSNHLVLSRPFLLLPFWKEDLVLPSPA